jgi:DnaJ-class molecular chaperone
MPKDYYVVLGVSRGSDLKKIKNAYRRVVKKHHPDATGSKESTERFMEIKEAYETLGDEAKRRLYDEELASRGSPIRIISVPDIIERRRAPFEEMDRFSSFVDDFFSGLMPGFFVIEKRKLRHKDLYYEAILSPDEAARGGLYPIKVPVFEPCPRCHRSGIQEAFFCIECSGYGRIQSERSFSLSIPPGVRHGTRIHLSMEDIGLHEVFLNVLVLIDPDLEEMD